MCRHIDEVGHQPAYVGLLRPSVRVFGY